MSDPARSQRIISILLPISCTMGGLSAVGSLVVIFTIFKTTTSSSSNSNSRNSHNDRGRRRQRQQQQHESLSQDSTTNPQQQQDSATTTTTTSTTHRWPWRRSADVGGSNNSSNNNNNKNRRTTYHRLLMATSIFDCIFSIGWALGPIPIPSSVNNPIGGYGTQATCSFQSILQQLGMTSFAYASTLMIYFVLVIPCGLRPPIIAKRYEPWLHGIPIIFHFAVSIAGLFYPVYGPQGISRCWIGPPAGTRTSPNLDLLELFGFYLRSLPQLIYMFVSILCLLYIGGSVWKQYRKQKQHRYISTTTHQRQSETQLQSQPTPAVDADPTNLNDHTVHRSNGRHGSGNTIGTPGNSFAATNSNASGIDHSGNGGGGETSRSSGRRISVSMSVSALIQSSRRRSSALISNTSTAQRQPATTATVAQRQMKLVVTQCFLYGFTMLNSTVWVSAATIHINVLNKPFLGTGKHLWWTILINIFFPLQGLFNALIFLRPRYLAVRRYDSALWKRHVEEQRYNELLQLRLQEGPESQSGSQQRRSSSNKSDDDHGHDDGDDEEAATAASAHHHNVSSTTATNPSNDIIPFRRRRRLEALYVAMTQPSPDIRDSHNTAAAAAAARRRTSSMNNSLLRSRSRSRSRSRVTSNEPHPWGVVVPLP